MQHESSSFINFYEKLIKLNNDDDNDDDDVHSMWSSVL